MSEKQVIQLPIIKKKDNKMVGAQPKEKVFNLIDLLIQIKSETQRRTAIAPWPHKYSETHGQKSA